MNGPRHMGNAGPGQVGMQEVESPDYRPSPEVLAELQEQFLFPLKKVVYWTYFILDNVYFFLKGMKVTH